MSSPTLTINLSASEYTSESYDYTNGYYVFNMEQGRRFYLRYDANTSPPPTAKDVELYRDGRHLQRSPTGTIILEGNYMEIKGVDQRYVGLYTIKCSNGAKVTFRLKVTGKKYQWI